MLYISRFVARGVYGVVDTDDDTETSVTFEELEYAISLGVSIAGVFLVGLSQRMLVTVYQDMRYMTVRATKYRLVSGVETRLYKGEIEYIGIDDLNAKSEFTYRPSLVAKRINSFVDISPVGCGTLRVVLDDNIEVCGGGCFSIGVGNVCFDITEVTNERTVEAVYRDVVSDFPIANFDTAIIDLPERKSFWYGIYRLSQPNLHELDGLEFDKKFASKVMDVYKDDFMALLEVSESTIAFVDTAAHFVNNLESAVTTFQRWDGLVYWCTQKLNLTYMRLSNFVTLCSVCDEAISLVTEINKRMYAYIEGS